LQWLVVTPAGHAWKAKGHAGFVAGGFLDTFEGDLEDMLGGHLSHGAKFLQRVTFDPSGNFAELGIGQAGIGFGEGHQIIAVPHREGEVCKEVGAPP